jgi:cytochrome c oxidase subunit 4
VSRSLRLFVIYLALLGLLALSVWLAQLSLGALGTALSLGIAALKAALVVAVFMHLDEESSSVRLIASGAGLWLLFLVGLVLSDYFSR